MPESKRIGARGAVLAALVALSIAAACTAPLAGDAPQFTPTEATLIEQHEPLRTLLRNDPVRLRRLLDESRRESPAPGPGRSSAEASYDLLQLLKKVGQTTTAQ